MTAGGGPRRRGGEGTLDRVVASWGTSDGLSDHARRAAGRPPGRRPGPGHPVPGCACPRCAAYAAGGTVEDAFEADELVAHLAALPPDLRAEALETARRERARLGLDPDPSPVRDGVLVALAARVPGAVRTRAGRRPAGGRHRRRLPVERARRVPIREVARRLGMGEMEGKWGEPRVLCPFHDDHNPSLRLNTADGLYYCDVCARGGDSIDLWRRVRGVGFADAVRELVP